MLILYNNEVIATINTTKIRFTLFIILVVGAPFSKYPSISLPLFNFPSFRFGLYQLLAVAFIILCIKPIYHLGAKFFAAHHRFAYYALVIIGVLSTASIVWSLYLARSALLAVSVLLLIAVVFTAWWYVAYELTQEKRAIILNALLYASITFGLIALIQLIIYGLTDYSLGIRCRGCTAEVFGFPRVNGFTAEPQFFANAMIPFIFASLYAIIKQPSKLAWTALVASVGTIGLTFSRGAYVALSVSLIVVGINLYTQRLVTIKDISLIFGVTVLSLIGSLLLLVTSATIRYNDTPNITYETIDSIAEHLTNGIINLPESARPQLQPSLEQPTQTNTDDAFVSPGLIEESAQERLGAAELAVRAWQYNPATIIFGVGIGNLGPFVVANIEPSAPDNLTVYIYYILLLSELGIVGLFALFTIFGSTIKSLITRRTLGTTLIAGMLIAFAVQFLFFGSYINVVYIWLWIGTALGITSLTKTQKTRVNKV